MIPINIAQMILEVGLAISVLLMVITIFYTNEMLTSEMLMQLCGFIGTAIIFYVVITYPIYYSMPSLQVPYVKESALLLLGIFFGFILPVIGSLILYNRMRRIQKIITYMNRSKERLNIMTGKIGQVQTHVNNALDEVRSLIIKIRSKLEEIDRITFIRW